MCSKCRFSKSTWTSISRAMPSVLAAASSPWSFPTAATRSSGPPEKNAGQVRAGDRAASAPVFRQHGGGAGGRQNRQRAAVRTRRQHGQQGARRGNDAVYSGGGERRVVRGRRRARRPGQRRGRHHRPRDLPVGNLPLHRAQEPPPSLAARRDPGVLHLHGIQQRSEGSHRARGARHDRIPGRGKASQPRRRLHAVERRGGRRHHATRRRKCRRPRHAAKEDFYQRQTLKLPVESRWLSANPCGGGLAQLQRTSAMTKGLVPVCTVAMLSGTSEPSAPMAYCDTVLSVMLTTYAYWAAGSRAIHAGPLPVATVGVVIGASDPLVPILNW